MIILFASDKGGVGKSTTAVNIAVMLVNNNKSVIILKTDKNPDLLNWQELRREAELAIIPVFEAYGNVSNEIIRLKNMCEVLIIDCAGHDSTEFRSALTVTNVLITLIKPSSMFEKGTLTKLTETVRDPALKNPNLKANLLMTRVKYNKIKDADELERELRSDSIWIQPLKTRLSELDIFESAVNLGAGVHEVERGSSLTKAKAQLELIGREIGLMK
ncbi:MULTISPECIES: AAA family ATPase [Arsenophonus]|uniref:AAA family ATPase n=1 Tax=Arsenophonus nasoniae TaxID=638 RepID=A0AA95K8V1_9GAMM|nr:AAA family ATPase [Arsenophonus nasoniae]WGM03997.1 AAA family ATPase [Arsenophonus nasoniae]